MNLTKLKAVCLFSLGFSVLYGSSAAAAPNSKAMELMQQGYEACKNAHLLRRKDIDQANQAFGEFLAFKDQAELLEPRLLTQGDADIERIVSYCDTVGSDLARTEALPIFALGVSACGEAIEQLGQGNLKSARKAYAEYEARKDEAILKSKAVLDVFSVRADMRRCERVADEIAAASAEREAATQQLAEAKVYLQGVKRQCLELEGQLTQAAEGEGDGIEVIKGAWSDLNSHLAQLPHQQLLVDTPPLADEREISAVQKLQRDAKECVLASADLLKLEEQRLIALAEEKARQEAELLQQAQASLQPAQSQEESEEQKKERWAANYEYYELVKRVAPEFPRRALRGGFKGYVVIEYIIDTQGQVIEPKVVESQPDEVFDKAALSAIKQWQYKANFSDREPDVALARTRMLFNYSD